MSERFDVVVVGSGAGGGVVAGELAERGRSVLLLECGPHLTAADFSRWEAKATHDLFWPMRFALIDGGAGGAVALLGGRCVGGSTTINTKVALRAHAKDSSSGTRPAGSRGAAARRSARPTSRRTTTGSRRASACASATTGRRASARSSPRSGSSAPSWSRCARTPTATACAAAPACRAARPTRASRRSTPTSTTPGPPGVLELRAGVRVERVVIEDGEATGVEYTDGDGRAGARRRRRRRRRRGDAQHAAAAAALRAARQPEQPAGRAQPRLPPGAPRLRPVRRAAGHAHGVSDHRARDGAPARRGRRLRGRGDDDPGSDRLRDDARGRERPALGRAAGRGRARVPPLDRRARDGERREQRQRAARRERRGVVRGGVQSARAGAHRRRARLLAEGADDGRCHERPLDRALHDARAGDVPDGQRPGAVGRRRGRAVLGRQAALRRRRLARPAHALGQSVAHDHGAREPPGRAPRTTIRTGT